MWGVSCRVGRVAFPAAHAVHLRRPTRQPEPQDGHAGYSTPLDEQHFLVETINQLQKTPEWKTTAVVIAYDDSDGWYDHQMSPIVNQSQGPNDALTGAGSCGPNPARVAGGYQDRCGYGPRKPLLVISPYSKTNYVDHTITDRSSILKFVEDNWNTGRIGNFSFDAKAGSLNNMLSFRTGNGENANEQASGQAGRLTLDPTTGTVEGP